MDKDMWQKAVWGANKALHGFLEAMGVQAWQLSAGELPITDWFDTERVSVLGLDGKFRRVKPKPVQPGGRPRILVNLVEMDFCHGEHFDVLHRVIRRNKDREGVRILFAWRSLDFRLPKSNFIQVGVAYSYLPEHMEGEGR
jgi:hypothetical protein